MVCLHYIHNFLSGGDDGLMNGLIVSPLVAQAGEQR